MAGYAGYSMSNNAVEAYGDYIMPLSRLKQFLGLKDVSFEPCEWHHTSKKFNATDFYDARDAVRFADTKFNSTARPTPPQIYNRLLIVTVILEEDDAVLPAKTKQRLEGLAQRADNYYGKLEQRRQTKKAKEQKEIETAKAKHIAKLRKSRLGTLKYRCECSRVTLAKINAAFTGEDLTNDFLSQLRIWFDGFTLKQAQKCAWKGEAKL